MRNVLLFGPRLGRKVLSRTIENLVPRLLFAFEGQAALLNPSGD
jgi:hypothetical protein